MKNFRMGVVHYTKWRVIFSTGPFVTTGQKHSEPVLQAGVTMRLCTRTTESNLVAANLREKSIMPFPPRGRLDCVGLCKTFQCW